MSNDEKKYVLAKMITDETTHIIVDHIAADIEAKNTNALTDKKRAAIDLDTTKSIRSAESKAIEILDKIKFEIRSGPKKQLYEYYQYILFFISSLVTEDPHKIHFDLVRATLRRIDERLLEDKSLIDMMVRELIEQSRSLKLALQAQKKIQELFIKAGTECDYYDPKTKRPRPCLDFPLIYLGPNILNQNPYPEAACLFEQEDMFICDGIYLKVLNNIGISGNAAVENLKKTRLDAFALYNLGQEREGKALIDFWFNTTTMPYSESSPALQYLMVFVYKDLIKKKRDFEKKYPPALSKPIYTSVSLIHKGEVKESDDQIQLYNEGSLLASLPVAAIDPNIYGRVFRGVAKFRTVTGHRLLRFLPHKAHNQLVNGVQLCNVLSYEGGYAQLAAELGLNGKRNISDIKDLLHALAFLKWDLAEFSGNFITLGEYKQTVIRNQNLGVRITLGPELSPYFAHKHKHLLVPIPKDIQLVGPTQYFANQYALQGDIMAEFSNQSIRLSEDGVVILRDDIWKKGGLPSRVLSLVKESWTQCDDAAKFLEQVDKDAYTLGPTYEKELLFLKEQGEVRKQRSQESLRAKTKKQKKRPHK